MNSFSQAIQEKKILYFIPGQGADERLYKNLELDSSLYDVHYEVVQSRMLIKHQ
ncbi:MAG: hypothetical protein HOD63_05595 [Bacteroidetes bacterium]|nr:hypothetical protein [Bacteroidota bacterium]MBT7995077.1 hypothetical protein [Bacteroidota bacterium]